MPIDVPAQPSARTVSVVPSATCEVGALISCCVNFAESARLSLPEELGERANEFWADGLPILTEIVLLADRADCLDGADIDPFLARVTRPIRFETPPALETESDAERTVVHRRLERLASDKRLRTRLTALLRDAWEVVAPTWEAGGRSRVEATAADWSRRMGAGADIVGFLPEGHIARRDARFAQMARAAQRDGRLRVNPIVASRGHIIALPGSLSLAVEADPLDATLERRRHAQDIADQLRTLSDPTRLTILFQLANRPSAVSDLARTLHIAQPTASVHLRRLRESGLVSSERDGSRVVYTAEPAALDALLGRLGSELGRSMGVV